MNRTVIYIGDDVLELYPNTVVATTIQSIEVGDLSVRKVSHTNNIKAPWTPNNCTVLGYAYDEKINTNIPYSIQLGKNVQNGIEVMPKANIHVVKSNKKEFNIQIYENVADFFEQIKNKTLNEFTPIAESGLDPADIDAVRATTSGIIAAVVVWKEGAVYDSDFFLPSFFYHTFISSILESTGLTPSGNILTDARFTDLIIPYFKENFEYPQSYYSQFQYFEDNAAPQVETNQVDEEQAFIAHSIGSEGASGSRHGTYFVHCAVGGITWNGGTNLILRVKKNGVLAASATIATNPAPGGLADVSFTDFFEDGDNFICYVYSDDMSAPGIDYTIATSSYLRFEPDSKVNRDSVVWNELFHDVKAIDLIKDFFTRFAIIPKQVGNNLILKTLEEIIDDKAGAVDWSSKVVNVHDEEISFETSYGQSNNFNYQNVVNDESRGRGVMTINNTKLELTKDIFTSVFENCADTFTTGVFKSAVIPVYNTDSVDILDFANPPGMKLLTKRDRAGDEPDITFDATPRSDYKIGYFIDEDQAKDTGFQYFLDEFYPSLTSALQRTKTITKYFRLSEIDIQAYDSHKMIFVNGVYYILNKIVNFIPGKITKVELFKVS